MRDRRRSICATWPAGRFDGFWEFNLNPWDTAAGVLIMEEAGGKVTRFDGSPFEIEQPRDRGLERADSRSAAARSLRISLRGEDWSRCPDPQVYKEMNQSRREMEAQAMLKKTMTLVAVAIILLGSAVLFAGASRFGAGRS